MGNDNSSLEWVGRGEKERAASRLIALEQEVERLQTRNDDLSALLSVQDKNHLACIEQHEAAEAEVGRLQRDDAVKLAAANRLLAQRDHHRETLRLILGDVLTDDSGECFGTVGNILTVFEEREPELLERRWR